MTSVLDLQDSYLTISKELISYRTNISPFSSFWIIKMILFYPITSKIIVLIIFT